VNVQYSLNTRSDVVEANNTRAIELQADRGYNYFAIKYQLLSTAEITGLVPTPSSPFEVFVLGLAI